ncbi:MAG: amidohydrolase family protein [Acidimicrobiales bacterium]
MENHDPARPSPPAGGDPARPSPPAGGDPARPSPPAGGDPARLSPVAGGVDVHQLDGWLLLPAFAEPHAHLDKALTAELVPNPGGDLAGAIEAWIAASRRGQFTPDSVTERASAALELLISHGVTAVRSHVNAVPEVGAGFVTAVRDAARRYDGLIDVQIVALPLSPLVGPGGADARAALHQAIAAGVDVIGGCPHLDDDPVGQIDYLLDVADDAGLPLDLHTDETLNPEMLSLADLARRVLSRGFDRGVTASHCVSLGVQAPQVQADVAAAVADAGIGVVALPQTNLYLQARDRPSAPPRGLTAVSALVEAGATVAAGADNVQDPFNLVGRSDPLETAALMVMAGHRLPGEAMAMISGAARRVMGLAPVELTPGRPADLLAIDAPSVRAAIAQGPLNRMVFRAGRLTSASRQSTVVYRA